MGVVTSELRPSSYSFCMHPASGKMAFFSSSVDGLFVSILLFVVLAVGSGLVPEDVSSDLQTERRTFTITSSNGSFILDCGPDCRRKVGYRIALIIFHNTKL